MIFKPPRFVKFGQFLFVPKKSLCFFQALLKKRYFHFINQAFPGANIHPFSMLSPTETQVVLARVPRVWTNQGRFPRPCTVVLQFDMFGFKGGMDLLTSQIVNSPRSQCPRSAIILNSDRTLPFPSVLEQSNWSDHRIMSFSKGSCHR